MNLERWKETLIASAVLSMLTLRSTSCFDGLCASGILKQIYILVLFGATVFICAGILTFSTYDLPEDDKGIFTRVCVGFYLSLLWGYLLLWTIPLLFGTCKIKSAANSDSSVCCLWPYEVRYLIKDIRQLRELDVSKTFIESVLGSEQENTKHSSSSSGEKKTEPKKVEAIELRVES